LSVVRGDRDLGATSTDATFSRVAQDVKLHAYAFTHSLVDSTETAVVSGTDAVSVIHYVIKDFKSQSLCITGT